MTNPQRPTPQELGESILRGVKDFVTRATAPMQAAIKALGDRIDALPKPEKGEKGEDGRDGQPGEAGKDGEAGAQGPEGPRGADGANGVDGTAGPQGERGDAGPPGPAGADCDMAAVEAMVEAMVQKRVAEAVAAIPPAPAGKDGAPGETGLSAFQIAKEAGFEGSVADWLISLRGAKGIDGLDGRDALPAEPGRDGISCDEIVPWEEGKHFGIRFMKGDKVLSETKWLKPTLADLDEGTWQPRSYEKGSHVSWGGSTWFAKCETAEEPGRGEDWRLMAKKGRDGRDRTERHRTGDSDVYRLPQK